MQPKITDNTPEVREWPIIANVIVPIADWWRRHASVRDNLESLNTIGADEMARVAHDVGLSPGDLRELATHCSDAADLLDRRLDALGISVKDLASTAPAELRDMERLCTMCASKGRCARDLAADPQDPVWRKYCPNEAAITALAREGIAR